MIEAPDFLPLGSVVKLKGNREKNFMIVGRALAVNNPEAEGARQFFDYSLCLYPEGIIGEEAVYSNHDCIDEVVFRGYEDEQNAELIEGIYNVLAEVDMPRADPSIKDTW